MKFPGAGQYGTRVKSPGKPSLRPGESVFTGGKNAKVAIVQKVACILYYLAMAGQI